MVRGIMHVEIKFYVSYANCVYIDVAKGLMDRGIPQ